MRCLEYLGAIKQGMIQCVRLAIAGVTKNGHHLEWSVDITTKSMEELLFVLDLQHK